MSAEQLPYPTPFECARNGTHRKTTDNYGCCCECGSAVAQRDLLIPRKFRTLPLDRVPAPAGPGQQTCQTIGERDGMVVPCGRPFAHTGPHVDHGLRSATLWV